MHQFQKKIYDIVNYQSKLSGIEFNLGNLIKTLELAPQDMLVDIILSDNRIVFPSQTKVEICIDGNEDNFDENNIGFLESCIGGDGPSNLVLTIFTSANDTKYKVKQMLQEAKNVNNKYLNWASLMNLDTAIYAGELEEKFSTYNNKVCSIKINNNKLHIICRDANNDW